MSESRFRASVAEYQLHMHALHAARAPEMAQTRMALTFRPYVAAVREI